MMDTAKSYWDKLTTGHPYHQQPSNTGGGAQGIGAGLRQGLAKPTPAWARTPQFGPGAHGIAAKVHQRALKPIPAWSRIPTSGGPAAY